MPEITRKCDGCGGPYYIRFGTGFQESIFWCMSEWCPLCEIGIETDHEFESLDTIPNEPRRYRDLELLIGGVWTVDMPARYPRDVAMEVFGRRDKVQRFGMTLEEVAAQLPNPKVYGVRAEMESLSYHMGIVGIDAKTRVLDIDWCLEPLTESAFDIVLDGDSEDDECDEH